MNDNDKKEFAGIMDAFAEEFGGRISTEGMRFKYQKLQQYDIEDVKAACFWLRDNRPINAYPPIPRTKEIEDAIKAIHNPQSQLDVKDVAELQWNEVMKKLRYEGRNGENDFVDPITREIMKVQMPYKSWSENVKESDLQWDRKRFIEAYCSFQSGEKVIQIEDARVKKLAEGIG